MFSICNRKTGIQNQIFRIILFNSLHEPKAVVEVVQRVDGDSFIHFRS